MPFRPSPCSHRAVFFAHTNRIDRVFFSKSSLGHITGCKENALEFPLIWSHNDGFRPNNKLYEGKIRAFRRYSSSRGEIQEIRIAKETSYLLLLQPPTTSYSYDRETMKGRKRKKKIRIRKKSREREIQKKTRKRNVSGLSIYVNIPVTRARPSSPCLFVDEKFLTKRKNHEAVNFVDEKRKTILPLSNQSSFFPCSPISWSSQKRRCTLLPGNRTRMQTTGLKKK